MKQSRHGLLGKETSRLLWVLFGICLTLLIILYSSGERHITGNHASPTPSSSSAPAASPSSDSYGGWHTYESKSFGISFRYPPTWGEPLVGETDGTSGTSLYGRFSLNTNIFFRAVTTDYTYPIGGQLASSGCAPNNSASFACGFAQDKDYTVIPDLSLLTTDGQLVLIVFNQDWPEVLQPSTRAAFINLNGSKYKGVVFAYQTIPNSEVRTFDLLAQSVTSAP